MGVRLPFIPFFSDSLFPTVGFQGCSRLMMDGRKWMRRPRCDRGLTLMSREGVTGGDGSLSVDWQRR